MPDAQRRVVIACAATALRRSHLSNPSYPLGSTGSPPPSCGTLGALLCPLLEDARRKTGRLGESLSPGCRPACCTGHKRGGTPRRKKARKDWRTRGRNNGGWSYVDKHRGARREGERRTTCIVLQRGRARNDKRCRKKKGDARNISDRAVENRKQEPAPHAKKTPVA